MSLFCFLWMPLFYLFWRSIAVSGAESAGGIWALILGSLVAIIQFFLGAFISPGAFGLSRWFSSCIDIVTLPAVIPLLVCFLFFRLRGELRCKLRGELRCKLRTLSDAANYTNFSLLWLIPGGAIRAVTWSAQNDPALLVLTPILWTAIAVGVPFFINMLPGQFKWTHIPKAIAMGLLPFLAATVYWAFFSQKTALGFLLLALTLIPIGISVTVSFYRTCANS
ncbi:hypothetical protein LQZ19_01405 [Treponema primitia]|uniref:hypothetical protein n=1 Tax=Treponema primitia TaxID=88058 RepID=UPI00397EF976